MSPPAPSDTLMTVEEFERYRGDESWLYELLRGVLVREPGPGPIHGRLQSRMAYLLERWMEEWGERGAVMTHTGFVLEEDPPTARLPDVAWVPPERIPEAGCGTSLWRQGPDLAGEVTSPSNSWTEIQEKVTEYLAAGTRLVWVVDPPTRTVTTSCCPVPGSIRAGTSKSELPSPVRRTPGA